MQQQIIGETKSRNDVMLAMVDLKSAGRKSVRVGVPLAVPLSC